MTLNLNVPTLQPNIVPKITVIGVGGAGGNAVNNMIQSNLEGVDFLTANTDAQAMQQSLCDHCIQLGRGVTQGLGSGSKPDVGRAAAEEALDEILTELEGTNMLFITAGMGGGTGTGGAPVIARAAREAGVLTVGVVTKPFHFEGVHRMRIAEAGITELTQYVDTLIVIPNQNLFRIANEKTTFADAFKMADDVLHSGVRGVTDLMVMPGLINLDFADIRSVMTEMGKAMMGTGEAEGASRALEAAEAAISNPLLDDVSMKGARGVLINITGGPDMTLFEVDETANRIRDEVDPEANIIFGSTFDQNFEGRIRVALTPEAPAEKAVPTAEPEPRNETFIEVMEPPVTDSFIAPLPAEPEPSPEPEIRASAPVRADPFATAALENGSRAPRNAEPVAVKAPAPRKVSGFFAKMTGGASRAIQAATQGGEQRSPRDAVSAQGPAQQAATPRAGAAPKPKAPAGPAARAAEPRLSGFESPSPESAGQVDEDLLDIPAFLRRQAN